MKNCNLPTCNSSLESLLKQCESSQKKSTVNVLQALLQLTIFTHREVPALVSLSHNLFYEEEWVSPTQNSHILIPDRISPSALLKKFQPAKKRSTWINGSSQESCEFATPEHVLQKGSQTAPTPSVSWRKRNWRSYSRTLSQDLKTASVILLGDILSVAEGGHSSFSTPLRLSLQLAIMRCDSLPKEGRQDDF